MPQALFPWGAHLYVMEPSIAHRGTLEDAVRQELRAGHTPGEIVRRLTTLGAPREPVRAVIARVVDEDARGVARLDEMAARGDPWHVFQVLAGALCLLAGAMVVGLTVHLPYDDPRVWVGWGLVGTGVLGMVLALVTGRSRHKRSS